MLGIQQSMAAQQIHNSVGSSHLSSQSSEQSSPGMDSNRPSSSDKENSNTPELHTHVPSAHREIMEKLKHEASHTADLSPMDRQRMFEAAFHAASQKAKLMGSPALGPQTGNPMSAMFGRDALLHLQQGLQQSGKLDYLNHLALLTDQQSQLGVFQNRPSRSPPRNRSPERRSPEAESDEEDGELTVELTSPAPQGGNCQWTYEEQFKQLYELDDDPERKVFLDELFAFMQKRGSPVNRIPIMAKQTLDMYRLFKLVVEKGGLVEVINKKLWREITKGLNLPSSITSAAFTLRTQYMKYIYPYECEKYGFSNPNELQTAIDGNRREGRRPGFPYDMPSPNLNPLYSQPSFPGNPFFPTNLMANPMASLFNSQMNQMAASNLLNSQMNSQNRHTTPVTSVSTTATPSRLPECSQSPIDVSSPQQPAFPDFPPVSRSHDDEPEMKRTRLTPEREPVRHQYSPLRQNDERLESLNEDRDSKFMRYAPRSERRERPVEPQPMSLVPNIELPRMNTKSINEAKEAAQMESNGSIRVSMEVNGVTYSGLLFPANKK